MIITGGVPDVGWTVELFVPSTGHHCLLPEMRAGNSRYLYEHSMEKNTVCGGQTQDLIRSCFTLTKGNWDWNWKWEKTTTLLENRYLTNFKY